MNKLPQSVPFGRLNELRARPDASLIAYLIPSALLDECRLKRYASRLALTTFLKQGGNWHALVKDSVDLNMLTCRNLQYPSR